MLIDHSYCNQAFVDGLKAFLQYTAPDSFRDNKKEGLIIRRTLAKRDFEKRCVQRWAISELINLIIDNPYETVEETSYKFAIKLLSFEDSSRDEKMKKIFHIAGNFIEREVLGLFRSKEGVYP